MHIIWVDIKVILICLMVDDCGFVLYPRVISSIPSDSYTVTQDALTMTLKLKYTNHLIESLIIIVPVRIIPG